MNTNFTDFPILSTNLCKTLESGNASKTTDKNFACLKLNISRLRNNENI